MVPKRTSSNASFVYIQKSQIEVNDISKLEQISETLKEQGISEEEVSKFETVALH